MNGINLDTLLNLAIDGKWTLVSAIVIGAIIRAFKPDTMLPTLPPQWRPWLALVLGAISGVAQTVANGNVSWKDAIASGLTAALTAMAGHDLLIESLRKGRELGDSRTAAERAAAERAAAGGAAAERTNDPALAKGGTP